MTIGQRIKNRRLELGLSVDDVAAKLNKNRATVYRYESNEIENLPTTVLEPLAEILKTTPAYLMGWTTESLIKWVRASKGLSLNDMSKITGVSAEVIDKIENDIMAIDEYIDEYRQILQGLKELNLEEGLLLHVITNDMLQSEFARNNDQQSNLDEIHSNIPFRPSVKISIPILGSIPAGVPIEAVQDVIGWADIPAQWLNGDRQYFGLRVHGDSMYPEYLDGDIIIIRKQSTCETGDDCAVMVNDADATLKRVRLFDDHLELEAINKMYGKRVFTNKEIKELPVAILGVVVELRRKKK